MEICLIQDTREQRGLGPYFSSPWIIETLHVGDYSVAGLQDLIAIERKSLSDLLGSLTHGRERFEKELAKTRSMDKFYIVVEGCLSTIFDGRYNPMFSDSPEIAKQFHSMANPKAIWETIAAFTIRYCPMIFTENQIVTAAFVESVLTKYAREFIKTGQEIEKAAKKARKV